MINTTDDKNLAVILAAERGYAHPTLAKGKLVVYVDGVVVDYVDEILVPRGLAEYERLCHDWKTACHLLGMLPPARGLESHATAVQFRIQGSKI